MKKHISSLLVATTVLAALPLKAAVSPHESTSATIDGDKVTLVYGRPYIKNPRTGEPRKIWGGLVPWGKVWRTGADAATLLISEQPLQIGDVTIPAGTNSLFTLPVEDGTSKLIINKKTGQWGIPYNEKNEEKNELGRVDLKKEMLDQSVDQFTMAIEPNPAGGGILKLSWEKTQFSVPFTVKK